MFRISVTLALALGFLTACAPEPPARLVANGLEFSDAVTPTDGVDSEVSDDGSDLPGGAIVVWEFDEEDGYLTRAVGDCDHCDGELYNFPKFGEKWRNGLKGSGWNSKDGEGYLTFDGENDYVELPLAADLLQGRESWSLQARVRPCESISSEPVTPDQALVSTGVDRFQWGLGNEDLQQVGYVAREGDAYEVHSGDSTTGPATVLKGDWIWLTATFGPNGLRLYQGEDLVKATSGPMVPLVLAPRSLTFGAAMLPEGEVFADLSLDRPMADSWSQLSTTYAHFCGDIDTIRLFDRGLKVSELAELIADSPDTPLPIITDLCSAPPSNGCWEGEATGFEAFEGVVSCPVEDAIALWNGPEAYKDINSKICGHNWSVCTVEDVQARTPNRPLVELGQGAEDVYLLAQSGCGTRVGRDFGHSGLVVNGCACDEGGLEKPPLLLTGHPSVRVCQEEPCGLTPECALNADVVACGSRECRTVMPDEAVTRVLCCYEQCPTSLAKSQ